MSAHTPTPLPWVFAHGQWEIYSKGAAESVCMMLGNGNHEANAAFIVLACNSHGELVKALEVARFAVEHLASLERLRGHATATTAGVLERINAALSKAKGEAL